MADFATDRPASLKRLRSRTGAAVRRRREQRDASDAVIARVLDILQAAGLDREACIEVLGGALTNLAVAPYWTTPDDAAEAHALLAEEEPELAEVLETLAPWLLGRTEQREAISAVEDLLGR